MFADAYAAVADAVASARMMSTDIYLRALVQLSSSTVDR